MTNPLVAILGEVPAEVVTRLGRHFTVMLDDDERTTRKNIAAARAVVTTWKRGFSAEDFDNFSSLEYVSVFGTGVERIDTKTASQKNVVIGTTYLDGTDVAVAQFALSMMLVLVRKVNEADRFVRSGQWRLATFPHTDCLQDKSVGIVGLGYIGSKLARFCSALGLRVYYTGPNKKDNEPYTYIANVDSLAASVDILFMTCRGGDHAADLVRSHTLQKLGPNGYLINIAQPKFVNEHDLIMALTNGIIKGAALDVHPNEPFVNEELTSLPNLILTPHAAALTTAVLAKRAELTASNIIQYFGRNLSRLNR